MLDGSMSACAEANGVKVGDITNSASLAITNNFNMPAVDSAKPSLIAKAISSVRGALDPAGCARELAEARRLKAESDIEVYDLYRQNMPWLSERQAFLYANGFVTTPSQADNVFAVFEAAESKVADIDEASALPAPVVENVIEGAKGAYDDEARELWASVLAGEMESPGSVSKKTMAILGEMTKMEASAFSRMCDCSIEARVSDGETRLVSFVWSEDIDDLSLTRDESESLDALGLTRMHTGGMYVYGNLPFQHDGTLEFSMAGRRYFVRKGEGSLHIRYPDFTRHGRELARICGIGCDPRFQKDLFDWFDHWGAYVEEIV